MASRVHQATVQLLETGRLKQRPPWYDIVGKVPPSQILVRTQPVQHDDLLRKPRTKKASRLFRPTAIRYPEDDLRREFFKDHPWELARPTMVLEDEGKDSRLSDWSSIRQVGRPLDGER